MSQHCVIRPTPLDQLNSHSHTESGDKEPLLKRPHRPTDLALDMNGDVEMSIGPQNEKIRCRRLTLKSSPIFDSILIDNLLNGRNHEVIELPDVQPQHFRNFLKYVEDENCINAASFTPQDIAEILRIAKKYSACTLVQEKCRQFLQSVRSTGNAITIYQSVQSIDEPQLEYDTFSFIVNNFAEIIQSKDFLSLTHSNLCTFLKCDEIVISELHLFQAVHRWAIEECDRQSLEKTPNNYRLVLHTAVQLIRYPLMSLTDFQLHVSPTQILTEEEQSSITQYLSRTELESRKKDDLAKTFPFNHKRRGVEPPKTFTVCFYDCLIYNSEVYTGKWCYNLMKVDHVIDIISFGFDGPIQNDAVFEVRIKLMTYEDENQENSSQILDSANDFVLAKKERTFYVKFENPVRIQPNTFYKLGYSLQGPKTIWGVQPKSQIKVPCGNTNVTFTYECVDGQVPEVRFSLPSITKKPTE